MGRKKIKVAPEVEKEIEATKEMITLADQYIPLIFDETNIKVLTLLLKARAYGGLQFSKIGEHANVGKSQKLASVLNTLRDYGLIYQENGRYDLTEIGVTASTFAENLVKAIVSEAGKSQAESVIRLKQSYQAYSEVSEAAKEEIAKIEKIRKSP